MKVTYPVSPSHYTDTQIITAGFNLTAGRN